MSSSTDPENYSENIFGDLGKKNKKLDIERFFSSYFLLFTTFYPKFLFFFLLKHTYLLRNFFFQRGGGIFKENIHPSFLF